jgi:hypothetical protein
MRLAASEPRGLVLWQLDMTLHQADHRSARPIAVCAMVRELGMRRAGWTDVFRDRPVVAPRSIARLKSPGETEAGAVWGIPLDTGSMPPKILRRSRILHDDLRPRASVGRRGPRSLAAFRPLSRGVPSLGTLSRTPCSQTSCGTATGSGRPMKAGTKYRDLYDWFRSFVGRRRGFSYA